MKPLKIAKTSFSIFLAFILFGCVKDNNTGNGTTDIAGVWQRYDSPFGYNSDLAIGGIQDEPANRVYLCEHPGSPSAGLYKGTLNGNIITWDPVYQLPAAEFKEYNGEMRLYYGVGTWDQAGKYRKGNWTNTCGPLVNSTKKVAVAERRSDHPNEGVVGVWINNKAAPVTPLTATAPNCSTPGDVITLDYTSTFSYSVKIMVQTTTIDFQTVHTTYNSTLQSSLLTSSCNKLLVRKAAGTFVLLPL